MTIHQTSSSSSLDLWQLLEAQASSQSGSASSSTQTSSTYSTSDSTSVSDPGKLFKELEQLSKTNPAEFKKIAASISKELTAAAKNSTDPGQAQFLTNMAAHFEKASQSGNFSDLFPHQGGSSASSSSSTPVASQSGAGAYSSSATDPLTSIFSQALQQIQSDLKTTTSASS